jgi:hypothetical protein
MLLTSRFEKKFNFNVPKQAIRHKNKIANVLALSAIYNILLAFR